MRIEKEAFEKWILKRYSKSIKDLKSGHLTLGWSRFNGEQFSKMSLLRLARIYGDENYKSLHQAFRAGWSARTPLRAEAGSIRARNVKSLSSDSSQPKGTGQGSRRGREVRGTMM